MVLFGDQVSKENINWQFFLFEYFVTLAKFLPVAFGVKKLQIGCVVEDDKVDNLWISLFFLKYFF